MRINEEKLEAAYDGWNLARKQHHGGIYGVVHGKDGDTVYDWLPDGKMERIVFGGYGRTSCSSGDDDVIARAMTEDRFAVYLAAHWDKSKLLRVWPAISENWSMKSAHPMIGGQGTISGAVFPS